MTQPPLFGADWVKGTQRGEVFGDFAADYDTFRPTYPPALFDALLQRHAAAAKVEAKRGADIGCGTGRGVLALASRGIRMSGVDTDSGMLAQLRASAAAAGTSGLIDTLKGSAEATGLPDASVDVVCCLQAWHWFDAPKAHDELRRVLRPGGVAVVAWNDRDLANPFVQRLEELIERYNPSYERHVRQCDKWAPSIAACPEVMVPDGTEAFPHVLELGTDAEALVRLCMTFSYVRCAIPEGATLESFKDECRALAQDMLKAGPLAIPLICKVFFLRRPE